jgi:hypothetical protein
MSFLYFLMFKYIYEIWSIFSPSAHNILYVFFGILQHSQPSMSLYLYCVEKENFHNQLNTLGVSSMLFWHAYYYLLSFCDSLLTFLFFFCSFPFSIIFGVVLVCFCCWQN